MTRSTKFASTMSSIIGTIRKTETDTRTKKFTPDTDRRLVCKKSQSRGKLSIRSQCATPAWIQSPPAAMAIFSYESGYVSNVPLRKKPLYMWYEDQQSKQTPGSVVGSPINDGEHHSPARHCVWL